MSTLRELLAEATPGPWAWFDSFGRGASYSSPYLATVDRGRIYVMGFVRRGLHAAQPCFQVRGVNPDRPGDGFMRSASEIGPDWRKHPDAALIAAAVNALPALLDVAEAARAFMTDDYTWDREAKGDPGPALTAALRRLDGSS